MHDLIKKDWMRNQQNITIVKTIANTDVCFPHWKLSLILWLNKSKNFYIVTKIFYFI